MLYTELILTRERFVEDMEDMVNIISDDNIGKHYMTLELYQIPEACFDSLIRKIC